MEKKCRVCVVDNHTIFREGIKALLSANSRYEVVAEAEDGLDALQVVRQSMPDVVLLDLNMPKMNGLEVIKSLKSRFPELKIVVLTAHDTEEYVHASLGSGANAFVLKDANHVELDLAINAVLKNHTFLSPAISAKVVDHYLKPGQPNTPTASWDILTKREREHLKLIAEAYSNKQIADFLCISVKTVEKHRANLMKKLGMHNVVELTAYAIGNGIIEK